MHHFDLYRLGGQDDLGRLDMGKASSTGVCLVEWAERLEDQAPAERLAIHISMLSEVCPSYRMPAMGQLQASGMDC